MAYIVDENGNAKTTLNVVVPTLHDTGMDAILLMNGGVILVAKGTRELSGGVIPYIAS